MRAWLMTIGKTAGRWMVGRLDLIWHVELIHLLMVDMTNLDPCFESDCNLFVIFTLDVFKVQATSYQQRLQNTTSILKINGVKP